MTRPKEDYPEAIVVPTEEAGRIKSTPRWAGNKNDTYIKRLRDGEVLFFPGRSQMGLAGGIHKSLALSGQKPTTRVGERDGVKGIYVWAVSK